MVTVRQKGPSAAAFKGSAVSQVLWIPEDDARVHTENDCAALQEIEGKIFVEQVDELSATSVVTEALGVVELCERCLKQLRPRPRADAKPVMARPLQTFEQKRREPPPHGQKAPPTARWNGQSVPQTVALLRASRDGDGGHVGVAIMKADGRTWTCIVPTLGVRGGSAKNYVISDTPNPPLLFHGRGFRAWRDMGPKATVSAQGHDQIIVGLRREFLDGLAGDPSAFVAHRVLSRFGVKASEPSESETAEAWFGALPGKTSPLGSGSVIIEEPTPGEPDQPVPATPTDPGGGDVPAPIGRGGNRPLAVTRTFVLDTETSRRVHLMASCPALNTSPELIVSKDHETWTTAKEAAAHWGLPVCGQCERIRRAAGDGRVLGQYTLSRQMLAVRDDGVAFIITGFFGGREIKFIPRQDIFEASPEGPGFFSSAVQLVVASSHEKIVMEFLDEAERESAVGLLSDVLLSNERP